MPIQAIPNDAVEEDQPQARKGSVHAILRLFLVVARDLGLFAAAVSIWFSYHQEHAQSRRQYEAYLEITHIELANNWADLTRVIHDMRVRGQVASFYSVRTDAASLLLEHPLAPRQLRIDIGVYLSAMKSRERALDSILELGLSRAPLSESMTDARIRSVEGGIQSVNVFRDALVDEFARLDLKAPIDSVELRGSNRVFVPN